MSKPGDVVEFKSGLHGIEAPRNLGVLVDRWRVKGVPWVRLVTVDGLKEVKAENLSRRVFRDRVDNYRDTEAARSRLGHLIEQHQQGGLVEEAEDDLGALEQRLWELAARADAEAFTVEELASLAYGASPSRQQVKDVQAALDRCRRPGTGRFETHAGRGDTWRPWTLQEVEAMRAAWNDLDALRKRMVTVEETEEGREFQRQDVEFTQEEQATLSWVRSAMEQFIEHDGVPDQDVQGIGGLGATQAFGMDLHRVLGFLAQDWIQSEHTTRSSDYVHFLLESGIWAPEDAVASLTRRHVNQEPFFSHVPDETAERLAQELPEPAEEQDMAHRDDLRHLTCYTIDPPDAKDFDDAVGIETTPGGQRLWVHIADVSHYVRQDTVLDKHAKDRATSVYLPGRVLPMLPHRIADHLCSLRDDGDRYAMSAALDIAPDGQVTGAKFHVSFIRVDENLTYDDALQRRQAGDEDMVALFELAERMKAHRRSLAIDTGETRIQLEDMGFDVKQKRGNDATRMIETFMVAANEAVAKHLADADVPLLYRCHGLPDVGRAERLHHQLLVLGIDNELDLSNAPRPGADPDDADATAGGPSLLEQLASGGKLNLMTGGFAPVETKADEADEDQDEAEPTKAVEAGFSDLDHDGQEAWLAPFRDVLGRIAEAPTERAEVASLRLLSCMAKAHYTPHNVGHFGLGLNHYCHFTSPIRRYPDLVVHRNLKWLIQQGHDEPPHPVHRIDALSDHCSDQEKAAAALERTVRNACLVLATTGKSPGTARITGITPASTFLLLDDGLEARAANRELPGAPYHVDEWESMLFLDPRQDMIPGEGASSGLTPWRDDDLGEERLVRARLGDRVPLALTGRDVAAGRTGARITAWKTP